MAHPCAHLRGVGTPALFPVPRFEPSPGTHLAPIIHVDKSNYRFLMPATFDAEIRRLFDAYPAIYLACHRRHVRDDETGALVTAHQAGILDHLDVKKPLTLSNLAEHLGIGRTSRFTSILMAERPTPRCSARFERVVGFWMSK